MGRNFVITGGNSGIGAATAIQLCKSGEAAKLSLIARNEEKLKKVSEECKALNDNVQIFTFAKDLTNDAQCEEAINGAAEAMTSIDVLVSNAGTTFGFMTAEDMNVEKFRKCLDINLTSHVVLTKAALPHLKKTKGNIVYVSSIAAFRPNKAFSHYCSAKAGLDMYAKVLATEQAANGIRVNCVNPGMVVTPIFEEYGLTMEAAREAFKAIMPTGRAAEAEDIAILIEFIASEKNRNMTGSCVTSDGGFSIKGDDTH